MSVYLFLKLMDVWFVGHFSTAAITWANRMKVIVRRLFIISDHEVYIYILLIFVGFLLDTDHNIKKKLKVAIQLRRANCYDGRIDLEVWGKLASKY